ncbi:cytochrome c maturation protein CcmE [Marichromatium bheemlicum]|uniref:Cytochrome c-type biogenesis protein CcmE n=1 Tax=Marichromatium bheemlicum TaxID=365339 RepID=A0ABX1I7K5_9GAMM|nr:cytochrome c maturation protein CcmE [Marichromatium bheemlicum]NKN33534.1 cytochrome c maturation protein CcmE [Marichromatium bheemlicum]
MKPRQKRLLFVALAIVGVGTAATLALTALNSNISYFFSPTQVLANEAPQDRVFRLGGLVTEGSIQRQDDGLTVHFDVTDNAETVTVAYTGILPDLFSEGQGVVTKGRLGPDGVFYADEVLAKHDESYMPPEVESTLKTAQADGVSDTAETAGVSN